MQKAITKKFKNTQEEVIIEILDKAETPTQHLIIYNHYTKDNYDKVILYY